MHSSRQQRPLRVRIDELEQLLMFDYDASTQDALFDIVDASGRIVKTGDVQGPVTRVRITDLGGRAYFLMVLDGELSVIEPIQLRKAG